MTLTVSMGFTWFQADPVSLSVPSKPPRPPAGTVVRPRTASRLLLALSADQSSLVRRWQSIFVATLRLQRNALVRRAPSRRSHRAAMIQLLDKLPGRV